MHHIRFIQLKVFLSAMAMSYTMASLGQSDTVKLSSQNIIMSAVKPRTTTYLVFFKWGKDSAPSRFQFWMREVTYLDYQGQPALLIKQQWEASDTVIHTAYSVCNRLNFSPLFQRSWWRNRGNSEFNFIAKTATLGGKSLGPKDTALVRRSIFNAFVNATNEAVLNWHLDLEVFSTLPYRLNRTFLINFYDPGFDKPELQSYTVIGTDTLPGFDKSLIPCWILFHSSEYGPERFWISQKTNEVLKLEDEYQGHHRYKIKLPFAL